MKIEFCGLPAAVAAMSAAGGLLLAGAGSAAVQAQGKQMYSDPGGVYSVSVPAGWQAQPQQGSPMVSIVNEKTKVSETLGVMRGPEASTPSAEKALQSMEAQFPQSCPQAKILERGQESLAGMRGSFLSVSCKGQDGPETMKFIASSRPGVVAMAIVASPGNAYLREMLPLHAIAASLRVLPAAGGAGAGSGAATPAQDTQGAGAGGGQGMDGGAAQAGGDFPSPGGGGQGVYQDPQGRYSLAVPAGWNTASDNGTLTLSSGPSWVTVMAGSGPSGGATGPADVNHQIMQQIQAQFKQFQLLNEGDFQNNGHPSHGSNATGINPKGQRVSLLVVTVNAGGSNYLTMISSAPNDQAKQINRTVMEIAQSLRFGGK